MSEAANATAGRAPHREPTAVRQDLTGLMKTWAEVHPDRIWLSEGLGEARRSWTWKQALAEVEAIGAWLESRLPQPGRRVALLSRNRAHWILADMAIMAAGHVTVPVFTTQSSEISRYILDFTAADILFVGEAENWSRVREIVPDGTVVVRLPGTADVGGDFEWDDLVRAHIGQSPAHVVDCDDLATIVFTSGTTGVPKGVMHSHRSLILPLLRSITPLGLREYPRFLSYLPLAHLAEREQVLAMSLVLCGSIHFLERRETLLRDLRETRPTFFFGAPRIWEQLEQETVKQFGGHEAFAREMEEVPEATVARVRAFLGFEDLESALSGSAPISAALLAFYDSLGLVLLDGFGQTEAMGIMCTTREARRLGSIGKPVPGVEARLGEDGELLVKADGFSLGYFRQPKETAETFVEGWVHTGDRARIDEDGFYYITGRIKDYFKTIHGKYVAPVPLELLFASDALVDQASLLGRGYSKTVLVCTLSATAAEIPRERLVEALRARVETINGSVEKHARIGAVIVTARTWDIESGFLTTTLKVRRAAIEDVFGDLAQRLALSSAEQKTVFIHFEP